MKERRKLVGAAASRELRPGQLGAAAPACWLPDVKLDNRRALHGGSQASDTTKLDAADCLGNLVAATENAIKLLTAALSSDTAICDDSCHCRKSLELAIWTKDSDIKPADKEKMKVLLE